MEGSLRNTLIIIAAVIICGIFIHGLWTIRKNKNPYKLQPEKDSELTADEQLKYDRTGFDQDGIGEVRVSSHTNRTSDFSANDVIKPTKNNAVDADLTPLSDDIDTDFTNNVVSADKEVDKTAKDTASELPKTDILADFPELDTGLDGSLDLEIPPEANEPKSVYQQPVTQAKPIFKKPSIKRSLTKNEVKRDQLEINFDDNNTDLQNDQSLTPKADIEPEVIVLSVVMPENQVISGAALLPSLLTLGMKFGDMDIFHRHQDNAGNGKISFSLANMMNPGTFDLDAMETYALPGVTLFMTLPNDGEPFEVFDNMLGAAKQLANEFKAQILDDKRSVMTKQTEQHYVSKIRDFERRNRVSSS